MKASNPKRLTLTLISGSVATLVALAAGQGLAAGAKGQVPVPTAAHSSSPSQPAEGTVAQQGRQDAGGAAADQGSGMTTPLIDHDSIAHYPGWETPDLGRVAIDAGRQMLHDVHKAREAIDRGELRTARERLAAADALAGSIRLMTPYTLVVDRFSNAKQETLGTRPDVVVDDMLPIYASVEEMEAYRTAPDKQPKVSKALRAAIAAKAGKAGKDAAASQSGESGAVSQASPPPQDEGENIADSTVYLPVRYMASHIAEARQTLDGGKPDLAAVKATLDDALDSMVQSTVDLHLIPEEVVSSSGGKPAAKKGAATASPEASVQEQAPTPKGGGKAG